MAVFVADATGHGVQAALSTALLKSTFSRFAHGSASAADMLQEMNRALHDVLPADIFIAATLATVNPADGSLCVTNGGGPHPFHITTSGTVERVPSNGLFLGAVEPALYQPGDEVTLSLQPGDRVVFYTDGLTEVTNDDGVEFGDCGFVSALESLRGLGLDDVGARLVEHASGYARAGHEWDDVTILTMEFGDQ